MRKTLYLIGQYVFLLFFLYYYIGITAFVHTHQNAQFTVTHSHPFLPGAHHSHSGAGYETVNLLNVLHAEAVPVLSVFFALAFLGIIYQTYRYPTPHREIHHPSLRAPPVVYVLS